MASSNIIWSSSSKCDFCGKDCGSVLYDALTKYMGMQGPWATMCQKCYEKHGIGVLGLGLGQKYELKDGKYVKTGG